MTKNQLLDSFKGSLREAAAFIGLTRQAIDKWPDDGPLPDAVADRIVGCFKRKGRRIPKGWAATE